MVIDSPEARIDHLRRVLVNIGAEVGAIAGEAKATRQVGIWNSAYELLNTIANELQADEYAAERYAASLAPQDKEA